MHGSYTNVLTLLIQLHTCDLFTLLYVHRASIKIVKHFKSTYYKHIYEILIYVLLDHYHDHSLRYVPCSLHFGSSLSSLLIQTAMNHLTFGFKICVTISLKWSALIFIIIPILLMKILPNSSLNNWTPSDWSHWLKFVASVLDSFPEPLLLSIWHLWSSSFFSEFNPLWEYD